MGVAQVIENFRCIERVADAGFDVVRPSASAGHEPIDSSPYVIDAVYRPGIDAVDDPREVSLSALVFEFEDHRCQPGLIIKLRVLVERGSLELMHCATGPHQL